MIDREKQEKVIRGLECCKNPSWEGCEDCPYYEHCEELARDALALLKAQEPRVMTLEELVRDNVVWLEDYDKENVVPGIYCDGHDGDRVFATKMHGYLFVKDDDYMIRWRCWTSRPTDEQREAVKWGD